ncbi:MAG TPA: hypothetical protein PLU35_00765, partial [Phycisphaerales bacterium]|nr:hypothetical protein [Phycisphaerales bacterium]
MPRCWTTPEGDAPGDAPVLLACADWLDAAATLAPASIDLLYADPPFNTGGAREGRSGRFDDSWPTVDGWVDWIEDRLAATLPATLQNGENRISITQRLSNPGLV